MAAQPAEDSDDHGIMAGKADRQHPVLVGDLDVGHVAHPQRLIVFGGDDQVLDLARLGHLRIDHELEGEGLLLDTTDRLEAVGLADLIGQVGRRETSGQQVVGPGLHLDLSQVAAGHVGPQDVRHILDARGQLIVSVIAELGRVVAAGQHQRHDGKDGRRHLFDGQVEVGRQLRLDGPDALPGQVACLLHIGAGIEIDGQLAAAADGFGADLSDADHGANRLLQRLGHLHIHVGDGQAGHPGDDGNAREGDLGIDAAGHASGTPDAANGEQGRGENHGTEIGTGPGCKVQHGLLVFFGLVFFHLHFVFIFQTVTALDYKEQFLGLEQGILLFRIF